VEPAKPTTIIVKRVKKGEHAHHGGAWKIAYADFVTAMMAFFLMLWLVSALSESQKQGLSRFFSAPTAMVNSGGTNSSVIDFTGEPRAESEFEPDPTDPEGGPLDPLDQLLLDLKEQIETSEAFKDYKDQLQLDLTIEGLRIQMMDDEERPMFDLGSPNLKSYAEKMLKTIGATVAQVPNRVSIAGHTDARSYSSGRMDYSNWELSADRANAARRALAQSLPRDVKFGRVVGLADSVPYDSQDPLNPANRRISIVVLNAATERAIGLREGLETK
jgi:chemotaxis protein MotB